MIVPKRGSGLTRVLEVHHPVVGVLSVGDKVRVINGGPTGVVVRIYCSKGKRPNVIVNFDGIERSHSVGGLRKE